MAIIDTHTHLDVFARRGELPAVLKRAREANVVAMITIGTAPDDWTLYRDLTREHRGIVYYTVGLHPCSVDADWETAVSQIEAFWNESDADSRPRPVALGECGLDRFHLPKDDAARAAEIFSWQQAAFARQLALARRLGCPLVVHSRGAFTESVAMIEASGVDWKRVVFHCFTEGPAEIAELVRRGACASFTGILTYKSAENVRNAAKAQGLAALMIETDAPFLAPVPHRGETNEPAFLRHTAEYAARTVFGTTFETFAATTSANARRFFALES